MKLETAELFKKHMTAERFEIEGKEKSLEFNHNFSDAEIQELVEAEYGTSITQSVPDLFRVIVKELLKMGIEFAKKDKNEKAND
jgi:hypothetical protein